MTDSAADQTPVAREHLFEEYQDYHRQMCQMCVSGNPRVCTETPVTEKAVRFLLSEPEPAGRFRTVDFYKIAFECVKVSIKDCRSVFAALIKATEVLEALCVNLFLYPWKKEIKSLKTYTGAFVYCIQSVLPASSTHSILASVGYQPQSDRHYLLTDTADPQTVIGVAFDLFLARKECEHLLRVMGQSSQPECLKILRRRAASPGHSEEEEEEEETAAGSLGREAALGLNQQEGEEDALSAGCSLVVPGPEEIVEDQMSSRSAGGLAPGAAAVPAEPLRPAGAPLNEDRSILEMQRNYPDLAIRKKPIFSKPPRRNGRRKQQTAGPSSGLTPADQRPPQEPRDEPRPARPAPPDDPGSREEEGAGGQPCLHEEKLRFPVEETGSRDPGTTSDLGSGRDPAGPILCHPSPVPICSIPGCNSCGEGGDSLREPPHSVYIPARPLELCHPGQATEGPSAELQAQSVEGPRADIQSLATGPRSPAQQPEDELVHTYVMVEHDRK